MIETVYVNPDGSLERVPEPRLRFAPQHIAEPERALVHLVTVTS